MKKILLQKFVFWAILVVLSESWMNQASAATTSADTKEGCQDKCGNLSIPYPFGIGDSSCALNPNFELICNNSDPSAVKVLLGGLTVLNISVEDGTIIIATPTASKCSTYNQSTSALVIGFVYVSISLGSGGPYRFSNTRNKLTAFGCDNLALMKDADGNWGSGCLAICNQEVNFKDGDSCSGYGCCQTSVPQNLTNLNISIQRATNDSSAWNFNPCDFAFLADEMTFQVSSLKFNETQEEFPDTSAVIEWVADEKSCDVAKADPTTYACKANTDCNYSQNNQGYRCSCSDGYEGNPYLPDGCQDINECAEPQKYPCHGTCKNTNGNYTCTCPLGMVGNGKVGCQGVRITTVVAIVGGVIFSIVIIVLIAIIYKRRRKEKNFLQNGGMLLKNQRVRIFTEAELAKATKNYDSSQLLGEGGFGSVYKGVLTDNSNTLVAVKKPKDISKALINQEFQHEIGIISQVNHKNVVKILGLCLETKVPLLVYEYIPNGTLYHHIHDKQFQLLLTWKNRLRIAAETALALDYLHSLASPPIIHGDVKSMNILLDNDYTAKVSDFGASVLISPGQIDIATKIQGTLGYLDPEYLMTGILTEKSDVYSFGVVLVELLTGKKPNAAIGENSSIIHEFLTSLENNNISQILGFEITDEGELEEVEVVAELAKQCLHFNSRRRTTMREVSDELARLRRFQDDVRAMQNSVESTYLLGESSHCSTDIVTMSQLDSQSMIIFDVEGPR